MYTTLSSSSQLLALGVVPLHVQGEVVRARERAVTVLAAERLGTRVLPDVARQLIRAREAPVAVGEVAPVGLLTCK